jgi:hypothetical protein
MFSFQINLTMKKSGLFCLSCWDFQTMALNAVILVSLESSGWVKVHWLGLFGATVWKLLIIEKNSQWKLNKTKSENCIWIWRCSWCCWKALDKSDLIKFISQLSKQSCEIYWFLSGFCWCKFKKFAKNEFQRKN